MILNYYILSIIGAGALGALASELLRDNCIEIPKKIGAKFSLGIIGSIIIGAIAGYYVDGSPETAFMAGFMGPQLLSTILKKRLSEIELADAKKHEEKKKAETPKPACNDIAEPPKTIYKNIEEMIRDKAMRAGVNPELAVAVARCESGLRANAININKTGSKDRGLYQWNDYWHPQITDKMAFDPEIATDLFLKAVKDGNLSWWNASKKCWGKYA